MEFGLDDLRPKGERIGGPSASPVTWNDINQLEQAVTKNVAAGEVECLKLTCRHGHSWLVRKGRDGPLGPCCPFVVDEETGKMCGGIPNGGIMPVVWGEPGDILP